MPNWSYILYPSLILHSTDRVSLGTRCEVLWTKFLVKGQGHIDLADLFEFQFLTIIFLLFARSCVDIYKKFVVIKEVCSDPVLIFPFTWQGHSKHLLLKKIAIPPFANLSYTNLSAGTIKNDWPETLNLILNSKRRIKQLSINCFSF